MRKKQQRFADNEASANLIQAGKPLIDRIKGNWLKDYFLNSNPIVLEVGCGRGEYTVGQAVVFPNQNFIGVDIKGARIWVGSSQATQQGLKNVAFLRVQVQSLLNYFEAGEVDEIWITFPDPRPKDRDEGRRLTNLRFMDMYQHIMKPGGLLHLKTDNSTLFEYTLELLSQRNDVSALESTWDLYNSTLLPDHFGIKTRYEEQFHSQGHDIKYLRCRLG